MLGWIIGIAAAIAAMVTGLILTDAPPGEIARVLFALFMLALVAAGLRSAVRGRPHG
jgi:hypothetical protein